MKRDLSPFLSNWDYDPTDICVRKIQGLDGREKLQVRLDLGVMQMELNDRPDGTRPNGHFSLLEYYLDQLEAEQTQSGTDENFYLDRNACLELSQEGLLFYHRYVCLMRLGDFEAVARDTAHNLALLDLVRAYAKNEQDREIFEHYRPYVLMVHTRARGEICLQKGDHSGALNHIEEGIDKIQTCVVNSGIEADDEIEALSEWAEEIERDRPITLQQKLAQKLQKAIAEERYEQAARLRDRLSSLGKNNL
ncbi:MAG: UvrB/UvrC motif-containing protein [Gemmatimonadetes bacterium]|nr:UvrB/UvrC motif-containing protein [Gemmatimonadota bacterium]